MKNMVVLIVSTLRSGQGCPEVVARTAKMRSRAIICYTCIITGLFVRDAGASDSIILLGEQSLISTIFGSWRVLLAIGILAGLINLLAKPSNRVALGIGIPKQFNSQPVALGFVVTAIVFAILSFTSLPTLPML